MTENQTSLFDVSIDEASKNHLIETAKWCKFFGILGYILGGLLVIIGLFISLIGNSISSALSQVGFPGTLLGIIYIVLAVLYFYPSYKLLQFSKKMPTGIYSQQQETVSDAFKDLKSVFRYFGILTIIIISLYLLLFIGGAVASMFSY